MTEQSHSPTGDDVERVAAIIGPHLAGTFVANPDCEDQARAYATAKHLAERIVATLSQSAVELEQRLFGSAGVFRLAYAGAGASEWKSKIAEFQETETLLRAALSTQPASDTDRERG